MTILTPATRDEIQGTRSYRPMENSDPVDECDHDWEVIDDSFDHEFGREVIVFERCQKCDAEREYDPPTFDDDVI